MVAEPGTYGCVAGADESLRTEPAEVWDNITKET
jgi:hypothetical protein